LASIKGSAVKKAPTVTSRYLIPASGNTL